MYCIHYIIWIFPYLTMCFLEKQTNMLLSRAHSFPTWFNFLHLSCCSPYSPAWAAARGSSARVSSPGVPSPRGPPEAAAGGPAERERGGSTERERKASRGTRKRRAKGGGELLGKICSTTWSFFFFFLIPFHSLSLRFRGCRVAVNSRRGSWEL